MLKRSDNSDFDFPKSSETLSKKAIVIGAGFGGLAAAMRLGSKGYKVSVFDKLNSLGGRGTSLNQNGYRFDLGPTIVTLPNMFRSLWNDCGRDFDKDVKLKTPLPFVVKNCPLLPSAVGKVRVKLLPIVEAAFNPI